jgi:hypothetical protein
MLMDVIKYLVNSTKSKNYISSEIHMLIAAGVRGSNPGGGEIFSTRPYRSWSPPSLLYNGYRVIHGCKAAGALR